MLRVYSCSSIGDFPEAHSLVYSGIRGGLAGGGESFDGYSHGNNHQVCLLSAVILSTPFRLVDELPIRIITDDQKLDVYMKIVRLLLEVGHSCTT